MAAGAEIIYQAVLFDGERWRGQADFLERVERPSALGAWSYEVADTKLARSVKPQAVLQLCLYSRPDRPRSRAARPSSCTCCWAPARASRCAVAEFSAYARRIRARLEAAVADRPRRHLPGAGRALRAVPLVGRTATRAARPTST